MKKTFNEILREEVKKRTFAIDKEMTMTEILKEAYQKKRGIKENE